MDTAVQFLDDENDAVRSARRSRKLELTSQAEPFVPGWDSTSEQHDDEPGNGADSPQQHEDAGLGDKHMSRRVNRKLDFALLPVLSLLYLFNGLDRGNVGNAQTQGRSIHSGLSCDWL
jgi:hypothetical protein